MGIAEARRECLAQQVKSADPDREAYRRNARPRPLPGAIVANEFRLAHFNRYKLSTRNHASRVSSMKRRILHRAHALSKPPRLPDDFQDKVRQLVCLRSAGPRRAARRQRSHAGARAVIMREAKAMWTTGARAPTRCAGHQERYRRQGARRASCPDDEIRRLASQVAVPPIPAARAASGAGPTSSACFS